MKTNELRCCSLLNVLNGNLSVYFTFTCALFFIAIFAEIPEHQEETKLFICSASSSGFFFMGFLFQVLFFQITGATLLNHIRPDLYLEISLKWNKMELLQSQAPTERELLGSSVVRTLEFGNLIFDLRMWTLDIRVWSLF